MLERARVAHELVHELEVNLEGAAIIVRMREELAALRRDLERLADGAAPAAGTGPAPMSRAAGRISERSGAGAGEPAGVPPALRRDLRLMVGDGVAFSVMVGAGEAYVPAFALAAGHGDAAAGPRGDAADAAPARCSSSLTPWGVARLRSHRRWVVLAATGQALAFAPLAPARCSARLGLAWIFLAAAAYWGFGMAAGPAWNTWVDDLVPTRIRPRFFAARNRALQAMLLLAPRGGRRAAPLARRALASGSLAVFAAAVRRRGRRAAALGAAPRAPERAPSRAARGARGHAARASSAACAARRRGGCCATCSRCTLAVQRRGALLHALHALATSASRYGAFTLLTAAAFVSRVFALPLLGRAAQRFGSRALLWFGATGIVVAAAALAASPTTCAGCSPCSSCRASCGRRSSSRRCSPFFEGIDRRERTSVLTLYNFSNAAAIAIGSLLGGAFFRFLPEGAPVYVWLFLASSAARAVALRMLWPIGTLRVPRARVVLRTLAIRPSEGALQRPIVATFEPSEADAAFQPVELPAPRRLSVRSPGAPSRRETIASRKRRERGCSSGSAIAAPSRPAASRPRSPSRSALPNQEKSPARSIAPAPTDARNVTRLMPASAAASCTGVCGPTG